MDKNFINFKVEGFAGRVFYDQDLKQIKSKVFFKRREVNSHIIKGKSAERACGLLNISNDIKQIQKWIAISIDILSKSDKTETEFSILRSLFISVVTTHWKCFSVAEGRNRVVLNFKKHVDTDHKSTFNQLKELRHNLAAHSGKEIYEDAALIKLSDTARRKGFESSILPVTAAATGGNLKFFKNCDSYISRLLGKVELDYEKMMKQIANDDHSLQDK